jgi:hypothetical protein
MEVVVVGEDLLNTHQVRPGTCDQLRDLLQLAREPVLDSLRRVVSWPFEVLQVPRHDSEHDPLPPLRRWMAAPPGISSNPKPI